MEHYIFIKIGSDIDDLANLIRQVLNLKSLNKTKAIQSQKRYSEHRGGTYYIFETIGLALILMLNQRDGIVKGVEDWGYYCEIEMVGRPFDPVLISKVTEYVYSIFRDSGIEVLLINGPA